MTTWTKELPKESGWFWYRESGSAEAEPALFQWRGDDEVALPYLWRLAPKPPLGGMFYDDIGGEFWPEKLRQPPELTATITVTPDMWEIAKKGYATTPRPPTGWPSITFPPHPIKVEPSPNQPHA